MINYDIYQLKDDPSLHSIRFANTKFMNTHNIPIDAGNYDKVYSGNVDNESAAGKKSTDEVLVQTATFCGQQGRISRPVRAILSGRL